MRSTFFKSQAGQTIIEVLLATLVVAAVLVAITYGMTNSTKNADQNKQRATANLYAQEVIEVFRRERDNLGWNSFQAELTDNGIYCLNNLPDDTQDFANLNTGPCASSSYISGTKFQRELVVDKSTNEVVLDVSVTWQDGTREQEVELRQALKKID